MLQVRSIEHRQKREAEAEEQRRAKQAELDAQRREKAAAKRLEQDAFERQLQARAAIQLYLPVPLPLAERYKQILDEHTLTIDTRAAAWRVPRLVWYNRCETGCHGICRARGAVLVQGLQPQVEKMETAWARLHTITGAETPEEVLAYFEGMQLSQPLLASYPAASQRANVVHPTATHPTAPQTPQLTLRMSWKS